YSRLLLQHLRQPVDLVRRMWAATRSGGALAVEGAGFDGAFCEPPNEGHAFWLRTYGLGPERYGGDPATGPKRHPDFPRAGGPGPRGPPAAAPGPQGNRKAPAAAPRRGARRPHPGGGHRHAGRDRRGTPEPRGRPRRPRRDDRGAPRLPGVGPPLGPVDRLT